ncbi:pentapeptide repeat-containing protein [Nodosilinea sp. LEGE 06152]|uniref:pentapeptide repeat-containing protein n=1 Tax=Nodosilinea sp. LEGE 06152 TaxID=2777966 RepID=UPI00187F41D2|nr:pentapeptide repeat-containing protein [Nodosilinea sp. LEGE 06152]MBE9156330.1 pentapeptide repeat-containing protein [Nodosilinea sp. LEGE 06152]
MLKLPTGNIRLWVLGSIAGLSFLVFFIWRVPQMGVPPSITDEKAKAELLNANRDNALKVIQTIAGLGFIVTAVLAWKNLQLTKDKNVTDRFSKAVEMLADEKLEVRLGGIYSLERIARDSKADHSVVMEVLTAFVRTRGAPKEEGEKPLSQDIQSTLTVIGRRTPIENEQTIDLSGANLSGANLSGANLSKANLSGANLLSANLLSANLFGANLCEANFFSTNLSDADLFSTNLSGANLGGANLSGAKLFSADLSNASLLGANLVGAKLLRANFSGAVLTGANLHGAYLTEANLHGAHLYAANLENIIGEKTIWPDITEVAQAINIPTALKTQLGIEVKPPAGPNHP